MATEAVVNERALGLAPATGRHRGVRRPLAAGLAIAMVALLAGDRGALTANAVQGIDPLEILNLQVKPNVVFVIDTSTSMGTVADESLFVGGDDPRGRLNQVKQILRQLISENRNAANFGIVDMNADQTALSLSRSGPFVYASVDGTAAAFFDGRFDAFGSNFSTEYDANPECLLPVPQPPGPVVTQCSDQIFRSFANNGNYATAYQGIHYMLSRLYRHGVRYSYDQNNGTLRNGLQTITTITCPPPPPGLIGDDFELYNDGTEGRACFQLATNDGRVATYYLTSPTYSTTAPPSGECDGTAATCLVSPVPACTAASNVPAILNGPLRLQIPLDPNTGLPTGLPAPVVSAALPVDDLIGRQPAPAGGLQIGAGRPLGEALRAAQSHYTSTVFPARPPAVAGLQKNYVIVIAAGATTGAADPVAQAAAMRGVGVTPGANDITTFVVAFNGNPAFQGSPEQAALRNLMSAGTNGRFTDVFSAVNDNELWTSLNFAFSETIASGTFETESSITESIFEYAAQANTATPLKTFVPIDPASRYNARVPTLLQSSFDMPGFSGHLRAFQSPGESGCPAGAISRLDARGRTVCEVWDAGEKLKQRIWASMCPGQTTYAACKADAYKRTFADLRGGPPEVGSISSAHPQFLPSSSTLLKRRIFTSSRLGVFAYQTNFNEPFGPANSPQSQQCPVPLWPPTTTTAPVGSCTNVGPVAPIDPRTPGIMDGPLGIETLTFAELQSQFKACLTDPTTPFPPGHACLDPDPGLRLARARKEARESILAFMAGAEVAVGAFPLRCGTGVSPRPCGAGAAGDRLFVARPWMLAESTLAVPAVVPPPLEAQPITHTAEYLLFRDGVRDVAGNAPASGNPAASGFGLRNPDRNAGPGIGAPGLNNTNHEPLMTVVYHASNDMVHAFRGGPCGSNSFGCTDTGGEELWGWVPFDQMIQLAQRFASQGRSPHNYMIASSVRFNDIFVPGQWRDSVTGRTFLGRWRTIMVIGRGIAGSQYTALDITSPGQFTRSALDTLPPFPLWSRGNPDTTFGASGGARNSTTDPTGDEGANDDTAYAQMGETWSVPAMAAVKPENFFGKQFVLFSGSGYAAAGRPGEGKTFYVLDALTGDVLYAPTVPDSTNTCNVIDAGETCPVPNALVANAAAYIPAQLSAGFVGNPAASTASLVYIGDLHGRMWKFSTKNPGAGLSKLQPDRGISAQFGDSPDQPIGSAVALLNLSSVPHVYWETGHDLRVIPPDPFKFVAMKDVGADNDLTIAGTGLFTKTLSGTLAGFRGTAQPATAFNATGLGRVFFIGTKFTNRAVAGGDCASRFDSVLFSVGAVSGGAVYDLDSSGTVTAADESIMVSGKVNAIRGSLGQIILDKGEVSAGVAPQAPPAPKEAPQTNTGSSGEVFITKVKPNSTVCR